MISSSSTVGADAGPIEWRISDGLVDYGEAVEIMQERVARVRKGTVRELVWMLEHPPLYTAGTGARDADLLDPDRFPVFRTGRGGQFTYHGPGQRVVYVVLDLKRGKPDIRAYIANLEEWIIRALARFNLTGERRDGRVGIWIDRGRWDNRPGCEDKIAAIGVRVRRWVTYHGIAINVEPDLSHFQGIVPCGIGPSLAGVKMGVTSLIDLGLPVAMADLDVALMESFPEVFSRFSKARPDRPVMECAPDGACRDRLGDR